MHSPFVKILRTFLVRILGADDKGFWFQPIGEESVYVEDTDGWMRGILESIELE